MAEASGVVLGVPVGESPVVDAVVVARRSSTASERTDRTVAELCGEVKRLAEVHAADAACCYFLYRRTAEEMVVRCDKRAKGVRDALTVALTESNAQSSSTHVRDAAETLRQVFYELSSKGTGMRAVVLESMPEPTTLLAERYAELTRCDDYPRGSVRIKMSTLRGAIAMATKCAKPTHDEGNYAGAYYVLCRSVDEMASHLVPGADSEPALEALRQLRAKAEELVAARAPSEAVLEMLRLMRELANRQGNPGLSEGLPDPLLYMMDDDFPEDRKAGGGGCCVIA